METRAHHVLVGFFTLAVVLAMMGFALWLVKSGGDTQKNQYDIVFQEAVTGLSKGSMVEFNGIRVGDVSNLRLDAADPRKVVARVRVDADAPVKTDTVARLVPTGLTGTAVIRLTSGNSASSTPLRGKDGTVPVIVAAPSPLAELMASGGDVVYNVNELAIQARHVFSPENLRHLERTLQNLEQTTSVLADQRNDLGQAMRAMAKAGAEANKALAQATRLMQSGNRLVDNELRQTLQSAERAMGTFERSMQTVNQVVVDNRGALSQGLGGVAGVGPALHELRDTLGSLKAVSRQLEERPADFLLNREPNREFSP